VKGDVVVRRKVFYLVIYNFISLIFISSLNGIENPPPYSFNATPQLPLEVYNVYRFDPKTKEMTVVIGDLKMPNGIAFSPDEKILYVIDSAAIQAPHTYYENNPHAIYAYDVNEDGKTVRNQRKFAVISPGFPDGMRLDKKGNIYIGALDGVQVLSPQGTLMGKILLPKETANLTFGGKDNNILFICSSDSIWAIKLNTQGCKPVPFLRSPIH
jgi:gluconolactonase